MTLDEMIAWLEGESVLAMSNARRREVYGHGAEFILADRMRAATLLTIENALRAVRDGVALETV